MKDRPILFSAPMVRALLAGTKTQTRRMVKPQFASDAEPQEMCATTPEGWQTAGHSGRWWCAAEGDDQKAVRCPYGQPGDRLWVRESWAAPHAFDHLPPRLIPGDARFHYAASQDLGGLRGRPSIHMPRWASRILLEVTGVSVERLQAISEADCISEGIEPNWLGDLAQGNNGFGGQGWTPDNGWKHYTNSIDGDPAFTPLESYRSLWESINGAGSWDANPWVWVVEFRRVEPS